MYSWKTDAILTQNKAHVRETTRIFRIDVDQTVIIHLGKTHPPLIRDPEIRIAHLIETNPYFSCLYDFVWDSKSAKVRLANEARAVALPAGQFTPLHNPNARIEDFEAPWYILQAISTEPTYLAETKYNFFTLIKLGNKFSHAKWRSVSF